MILPGHSSGLWRRPLQLVIDRLVTTPLEERGQPRLRQFGTSRDGDSHRAQSVHAIDELDLTRARVIVQSTHDCITQVSEIRPNAQELQSAPPPTQPLAESHQRRPLATSQGRKCVRVGGWQPSGLDVILESMADHVAFTHRADDHENHHRSDDAEGDEPQLLKGRHR